jgi:hypothetical protein
MPARCPKRPSQAPNRPCWANVKAPWGYYEQLRRAKMTAKKLATSAARVPLIRYVVPQQVRGRGVHH